MSPSENSVSVRLSPSELEVISAVLARLRGIEARAVKRPVGRLVVALAFGSDFFELLPDCTVVAATSLEVLAEPPLGLLLLIFVRAICLVVAGFFLVPPPVPKTAPVSL